MGSPAKNQRKAARHKQRMAEEPEYAARYRAKAREQQKRRTAAGKNRVAVRFPTPEKLEANRAYARTYHHRKSTEAAWRQGRNLRKRVLRPGQSHPAAMARRKVRLQRYKVAKGCAHCGYRVHAEALEFHHLNPAEKDSEVYRLVSRPLPVLFAEIRKCVVLCANCHRLEHARLRCEAANDNTPTPLEISA